MDLEMLDDESLLDRTFSSSLSTAFTSSHPTYENDEPLEQPKNDLHEFGLDSRSDDDDDDDDDRVRVLSERQSTRLSTLNIVESIFETILDRMLEEEPVSIIVKRPLSATKMYNQTSAGVDPLRTMRFPGPNENDERSFTVFLQVLDLIRNALLNDTITTKRDMFYKNPTLFRKQAVVDRCIDIFALTFNIPRASMNVAAAAKGLMAGAFSVTRQNGHTIQCDQNREGVFVPELTCDDSIVSSQIQWILVIEKEAIFRHLTSSDFWHEIATHGAIITGKGYPDLATRLMTNRLSSSCEHDAVGKIPIYAVMDFDPDGLNIFSTYSEGSLTFAHQSASLTTPDLRWVGLRSKDILVSTDGVSSKDLLPLSARDRRTAIGKLRRIQDSAHVTAQEMSRELQVMLMLGLKAEIEHLESIPGGLVGWLRAKLGTY